MKKISFKEWTVIFKPEQKGWFNIVASREIDAGTQRVKNRSGGWVTVAAARTHFYLAWNGERFADGSELKVIRKKHKALFEAICAALGVSL